MSRLRKLVAACLLAALGWVSATTVRQLSLPELLEAAAIGFRGTVSSVDVRLIDDEPWTEVTFDITDQLLAGSADEEPEENRVTLAFLGGSSGGTELAVALRPEFSPGDEVIVLAYEERYYSPVVGFNQGVWWLDDTGTWLDQNGVALAVTEDGQLTRAEPDPVAVGLDTDEVVQALRQALEDR